LAYGKSNDISKKLANPEEFYNIPEDVLNDALLSAVEQRRVLENWRERNSASPTSTGDDTDIQLKDALSKLSDAPSD